MSVRRALLLVAAATALTAVLGGLARLGLMVAWGPRHAMAHGPLFVLGVFGTVISLERAVALGARWSLVAPGAAAAAAIAMLGASPWAPWAAVLSALALATVNAAIVRRQSAPFTWVVLLGSLIAWLIAGGALLARDGITVAGPAHDAALHAVFVGHVLSMVFAHAPIILPAVARVRVPFSAWLYLLLGLLHVGPGGPRASRRICAR